MRPIVLVLLLAGAPALAACTPGETEMIRARAGTRFHCDPTRVTVREVGEPDAETTLYEASACGQEQVYRCTRSMTGTGQPGSGAATQADRPFTVCEEERQ